ncbi:SDR family oxidoreductase [uncultured Roseobacter sp.]|uniref:SDR family NAD(P)-dependent oxidoreductase n=1 Tax=uncultured Roseobacter sp. TaxID=114847 RepID=UPI0026090699|nr:SDR family oxidoreductase [uncultured Roseobacter sp.]
MITGGASGIGAALATRMVSAGAYVTVADLVAADVYVAAERIGCDGLVCDVTQESDVRSLCETVTGKAGSVDIFVSNAGYMARQPEHAASADDAVWQRSFAVHVMAQVYAARALLPQMLARESGCLVTVASAAGLLNQIGDAAYSATKQAAVSFAESLAITHAHQGLKVSVVCPQYVATPLIGLSDSDAAQAAGLLTADEVASVVCDGISAGRFLILPHPEVRGHAIRRAEDHDRWIAGMQKLHARAGEVLSAEGPGGLYRLL